MSKFIHGNNLNFFIEINKAQNIPILWISVSHCLYNITQLNEMQCANDPKVPLDALSDSDQNLEITKIFKKINELMN